MERIKSKHIQKNKVNQLRIIVKYEIYNKYIHTYCIIYILSIYIELV